MPIHRARYPADWEDIAKAVKEATLWRCSKCHKQCLRPGEGRGLNRSERALQTLTVHHANFTPEDNRIENLIALCAPCHLSIHRGSRGNVSLGQLSLW
ncbi:HNH endonuclease [Aliterella atlantica]|uniref:HNH endonuclease n=1 Tax=Aliterella atlantica CENA595 TaxID=1618023 RepID=A0A0D8ZQB2_9CYAN|nr:HNH endonuclease [Aliterella atlantica]KJH69391.1 HNH endonuclease [Aliterella atlantica CENA595]